MQPTPVAPKLVVAPIQLGAGERLVAGEILYSAAWINDPKGAR